MGLKSSFLEVTLKTIDRFFPQEKPNGYVMEMDEESGDAKYTPFFGDSPVSKAVEKVVDPEAMLKAGVDAARLVL